MLVVYKNASRYIETQRDMKEKRRQNIRLFEHVYLNLTSYGRYLTGGINPMPITFWTNLTTEPQKVIALALALVTTSTIQQLQLKTHRLIFCRLWSQE